MKDTGATAIIVIIFLVGVVLRAAAAFGDLWLDEIVSILAVQAIDQPIQILTANFSDNNHILNSLQIFLLRDFNNPLVFRLLPLFASVCTLILVWDLLSNRSAVEGVIGITLFSFSYLMILFGTEARGYSFLILFCVSTYSLHQANNGRMGLVQRLMYWAVASLGFLSHYTFVQFYIALMAYHLLQVIRRKSSIASLILNHTIPVGVISALFLVHMRFLSEGSGPLKSHFEVMINTVNMAMGGIELSPALPADWGAILLGFSCLVILLLVSGIFTLLRAGDDEWVFYLLVIFVMPMAGIFYFEPRVLFVRYFLIGIVFSYLLLARMMTLLHQRLVGSLLSLFLFGIFLAGNIYNTSKLFLYQRGQYSAAIDFMQSERQKGSILLTLSSDHEYRNRTLLEFYTKNREGLALVYIPHGERNNPPEWYITHDLNQVEYARPEISKFGVSYELKKIFRHAPLSGWNWVLYQRKQGLTKSL